MLPGINFELHPKQMVALQSEATEILYGGAAGGGKSHLMRLAAITWCRLIPHLQVYLFRRKYGDLVQNHMAGPTGFRALLADWVNCDWCQIVDDEIRFKNGARIYLRHCQHEKDMYNYQGAEIHALLLDELTHFTETIYRFLRSRLRNPKDSPQLVIPPQYQGKFPCVLAGANPGNVGHLFVKESFIENADPYAIRQMDEDEGGMKRQFIPAHLSDNPSLDYNEYKGKLSGLGSKELVRAMLDGDWDVIEGAFFDCWDAKRHIIQPFAIPSHWARFRSMDWGSGAPFSVGWWAVASDDTPAMGKAEQGLLIPRGALVRYREWYGAKKANVGLKMDNTLIAKGILERERSERIEYGVLDSSCFDRHGGPSIYEQMLTVRVDNKSCLFRPTDSKLRVSRNGVVGGWEMMRHRMLGDEDGRAMIYCFSTCHDSIRTIPAMQHDEVNVEDLNTDMEDHCADEWRYACMSRPWIRKTPDKRKEKHQDYKSARNGSGASWRVR